MAVDHLSLYQLTVEQGTAFGDRYASGKLRGLPDDDKSADMYALTQDLTGAAGFAGYEISNHAKPGQESRHNLIYWRYGDYAGIGPGAHGRLTTRGERFATEAPKAPTVWLQQVERLQTAGWLRESLSRKDQFQEFMMMGMRLKEGVDLDRLRRLTDTDLSNHINMLTDIGMVEVVSGRLRVTGQGGPVLNAVLRQLLSD